MRFLRRQSGKKVDAAASAGSADAGRPGGKGRPTPKRRDAEGRRRGPVPPPPRTQRESIKLAKQNRASRAERRKAAFERRGKMLAGDEKSLPSRDRGPVKAFIRDSVDSRRHLTGLFMPLAGLVLLALLVPQMYRNLINLFCMAMLVSMAAEGVLLGRQIAKRARERFPNETIKGFKVGWYAFTRALRLRRLRIPAPRVSYGDKV
ncbi:MAG: DUF3043 domain-containing protein [Pseudonocardia sp.]